METAIITKNKKALKGFIRSYNVKIVNLKDPKMQFISINNAFMELLKEMKGYKYMQTLVVKFKKTKILDESGVIYTIFKKAYFNSKPKIVINNTDLEQSLLKSNEKILSKIDVWISEGSGWTIKSVDQHFINFAKYQPSKGSSYVELPKELNNPMKDLINLHNKDNECFRWCHIRYLNPQNKNPQRIKNTDKEFIS